jgi:hypothetical protein
MDRKSLETLKDQVLELSEDLCTWEDRLTIIMDTLNRQLKH